jgi:putative peptidoglycan lipid II flippase
VLSPAFYALNDARTPMLVSLGSIAVNYVMNKLLVETFGHVGLAFSTSAVALVNFLLLVLLMRRRIHRLEGRYLSRIVLRISAASLVMSAATWLVSELAATLPLQGLALHLVQVLGGIGSAALVFYFACRLLRVDGLDEAINAIAGRFARSRRK